jgi:hypothetical protein
MGVQCRPVIAAADDDHVVMTVFRILSAAFLTVTLTAGPAGAQAPEDRVDVTFDVGDFDGERGDWPITVVYVAGDLAEGEPFTVVLTGEDGTVVWSATEPFTAPVTAVTVDRFVAVGDVVEAGLSQSLPEVAGDVVERPPPEVLSQGAGGGGSGQLALSMVLAVILVAIVFRTPLPSQTSQRWTK